MLRPVKSAAGRRTLVLPPSLAVDLRHHRRHQAEKRLASEVWEEGPGGGCVFANEAGHALDPRADHRASKELCSAAGLRGTCPHAGELRMCAKLPRVDAEDVVTDLELGDGCAHRLDCSG